MDIDIKELPCPMFGTWNFYEWQKNIFKVLRDKSGTNDLLKKMSNDIGNKYRLIKRISKNKRGDGLNIFIIEYELSPLPNGETSESFREEITSFIKHMSVISYDVEKEATYFLASSVRAQIARAEEWCEETDVLYEKP